MPITKSLWRYAKGIAYARTGRTSLAEKEQTAFEDAAKAVPADALVGLGPASAVLNVAALSLRAEIALTKKDPDAPEWFRKAVEAQDTIQYDEPPDWYYPIRESYGAVLLREGRAEEAEKVFRKDLEKNPRNGRSLFGLMESLKAQGKTADAAWVQQQFEDAWKNADTKLRIEDL
jgi:tetratricopeptide (TPR) repeat protein